MARSNQQIIDGKVPTYYRNPTKSIKILHEARMKVQELPKEITAK